MPSWLLFVDESGDFSSNEDLVVGGVLGQSYRLRSLSRALTELQSSELRRICHERDALESVITSLWAARRGAGLARELASLDEVAITSLGPIDVAEDVVSDPILIGAYHADPDAWWGRLTEPVHQ
jgi:hypothetical protein